MPKLDKNGGLPDFQMSRISPRKGEVFRKGRDIRKRKEEKGPQIECQNTYLLDAFFFIQRKRALFCHQMRINFPNIGLKQLGYIETPSGVSRAYTVNLYSFTPLPLLWILSIPPRSVSGEKKWLKQRNNKA